MRALFKVIATRSFGRLRADANAAVGIGDSAKSEIATDMSARFWAGGALDYPLTFNFLVLAEAYALRMTGEDQTEANALVGIRWQVSPRWVLDLGAGRGFTPGDDDLIATLGLTVSPGAFGL